MNKLTRRSFLQSTGKTGVGLTVGASTLASISKAGAAPASERVRLAIVGIRGRGGVLRRKFAARPDCEVAYLCDVDESLLPTERQGSRADPKPPPAGRERLSPRTRRQIDRRDRRRHARSLARAGDHLGMPGRQGRVRRKAGQPFAVGRPQDGRGGTALRAHRASRHAESQRGLQHGGQGVHRQRQARHHPHGPRDQSEVVAQLAGGRRWRSARRPQLGHVDRPGTRVEIQRRTTTARWNHFWRFSGGDIINDGVHQMDLARWLVGKTYPQSVYSTGGRYAEQGVFESPDTQVAVFQFDDLVHDASS